MEIILLFCLGFIAFKVFGNRSHGSTSYEYTDDRGYQRYRHNDKLVHRDVMEKKFGRKLRQEEVVHHRDRNKQNNAPRNLWIFKNQAEHDAQHKRDAVKYGERWSYNGSRR